MQMINTDNAPKAIGPYSQAIKAGGFLFISGQIPIDPTTMKICGATVKEQTRQCLENIAAILKASDCELKDIVKCSVYIVNMSDFALFNETYGAFFKEHKPARVCIEVSRLPKDVLIEIDAIAISK